MDPRRRIGVITREHRRGRPRSTVASVMAATLATKPLFEPLPRSRGTPPEAPPWCRPRSPRPEVEPDQCRGARNQHSPAGEVALDHRRQQRPSDPGQERGGVEHGPTTEAKARKLTGRPPTHGP